MPTAKRFCVHCILGSICTFSLGFSLMVFLTLLAWKAGWGPFTVALGPLELMEYQTGGSTKFAFEFGNDFLLLAALGGLIYGLGARRLARHFSLLRRALS